MSPSRAEAEALRRRYAEFLEEARSTLKRGFYDAICFLVEQPPALFKRLLLELVSDYPRTHSMRMLLGEISGVLSSADLERFSRSNRARPSALEDAYMMVRYLVKENAREDAEDMIKLVKEVINIVVK